MKQKQNKITTSKAPAARGTNVSQSRAPKVQYQKDGNCSISHSEYVGDISVDVAGQITQSYSINPQSATSFPWLSSIATRFEVYRFRKLVFHYKPSCATTESGYVALGFDFDFYDDEPTKSALLAWKYSSKSAIWEQTRLDVTPDSRIATERYCNTGNTQGDARLDYLGKLYILSLSSSTQSCGELFVEYTIEFKQPAYKIPPALYSKIVSPATDKDKPFVTPVSNKGNLKTTIFSDSKIVLEDVGQFLVSVNQTGSGIVNDIGMLLAQPLGTSGSQWYTEDIFQLVNSLGATRQILLDVAVPPVELEVFNLSGNAGAQTWKTIVSTLAKSVGQA